MCNWCVLLCLARRTHVQASSGDLWAACDQGEGGGCQAPPPPHGAYQSGAGSGEDCSEDETFLFWIYLSFPVVQPSGRLFIWAHSGPHARTFLNLFLWNVSNFLTKLHKPDVSCSFELFECHLFEEEMFIYQIYSLAIYDQESFSECQMLLFEIRIYSIYTKYSLF